MPSNPEGNPNTNHLFVVLTNPLILDGEQESKVLLVNASSVPLQQHYIYDQTCILRAGDHAFIRHDSYIKYSAARIEESSALLRGVQAGVLIPRDPMEEALVETICEGLVNSRSTVKRILDFYIKWQESP